MTRAIAEPMPIGALGTVERSSPRSGTGWFVDAGNNLVELEDIPVDVEEKILTVVVAVVTAPHWQTNVDFTV
jgi:hypothetical protein